MTGAEVSKGSVSGYLNEIEANIRCRVVRGRGVGLSITARVKNDNGLLSAQREGGGRAASVRDFHSFRVTWVTLALTAGVALELVQKVTGHKTVDIVLKHYFQPGREDFRKALESAMPNLLTNGRGEGKGQPSMTSNQGVGAVGQPRGSGRAGKGAQDKMRKIVGRSSAKTWEKDKARLLELLKQV